MSPSRRPELSLLALLLSALLVLLALVPAGSPAAAKEPPATYVIQGVPGADVDVVVDGETPGAGLAPMEVLGPLSLSPGDHEVVFRTADWEVAATVEADGSQDVVLHWPAEVADEPVVTVFRNDMSPVGADKGRLIVAHTAVVPPADILANGETLFTNIANGEFVAAEVPATTYRVAVVPTGGGEPLLGPLDLPVQAAALTRVFAIGAPREGSMDAVVQVLPLATTGGVPSRVDTGSAGLVRPDGSVDAARAALVVAVHGLFPWVALP